MTKASTLENSVATARNLERILDFCVAEWIGCTARYQLH